MIFKTCEKCGANLDPGEKCDCEKTATPARRRIVSHGQYHYITKNWDLSKVTFITKTDGEVIAL